GKPPFGGDRGPLAGETPEPGRGFGEGGLPKGGKSEPLRIVEGNREVLTKRPQWRDAEVRVVDSQAEVLNGAPESPYIIEVKVPMKAVAASTSRLRMWIKAWFKVEKLAPGKWEAAAEDVGKTLKAEESLDVKAASERVKSLIIDTYKADDVWLHIQLEG